jgi:hypothetical protein
MSYQFESQPSSAIVNSVPFAHTSRALAMAAVHMQAHALKDLIHVQIESLAFVKRRCEHDLKLIDDLITSEKYHNMFGVYGQTLPRRLLGIRSRNAQTDVHWFPARFRRRKICQQ